MKISALSVAEFTVSACLGLGAAFVGTGLAELAASGHRLAASTLIALTILAVRWLTARHVLYVVRRHVEELFPRRTDRPGTTTERNTAP